jgi:penicillin-binding protein-related factor A (putative recombinase)
VLSKKAKGYLGKDFEGEVRASLQYYVERYGKDFYWHKFLDHFAFHKNANFFQKQPGDFLVMVSGASVLFECKSSRDSHFSFNAITKFQYESLIKFSNAGGNSILLLRHVVDVGSKTLKVMYAIRIDQFVALRDKLLSVGCKSALWTEIAGRSIQIPYDEHNKVWLLNYIWVGL